MRVLFYRDTRASAFITIGKACAAPTPPTSPRFRAPYSPAISPNLTTSYLPLFDRLLMHPRLMQQVAQSRNPSSSPPTGSIKSLSRATSLGMAVGKRQVGQPPVQFTPRASGAPQGTYNREKTTGRNEDKPRAGRA